MEFFILVVLLIALALFLFDARSAIDAFDIRVTEAYRDMRERKETAIPAIFVFARWQSSSILNMGFPTVYYIPCDDVGIANKLVKVMKLFGTKDACVVDLPSVENLKQYVARFYELGDFDLMMFPIPTYKLLCGVD